MFLENEIQEIEKIERKNVELKKQIAADENPILL